MDKPVVVNADIMDIGDRCPNYVVYLNTINYDGEEESDVVRVGDTEYTDVFEPESYARALYRAAETPSTALYLLFCDSRDSAEREVGVHQEYFLGVGANGFPENEEADEDDLVEAFRRFKCFRILFIWCDNGDENYEREN